MDGNRLRALNNSGHPERRLRRRAPAHVGFSLATSSLSSQSSSRRDDTRPFTIEQRSVRMRCNRWGDVDDAKKNLRSANAAAGMPR